MTVERDDLGPEQQTVAAWLVTQGCSENEALELVRSDRFGSYAAGAHLLPFLQDQAERWAEIVKLWQAGEAPAEGG